MRQKRTRERLDLRKEDGPPSSERRHRRAHALYPAAHRRVCKFLLFCWHLRLLFAVENFLRVERKSALQPCSFPRPAFEGALGRNRGPGGTYRPTRPRRLDFPAQGPLTSPRLLWHNVARRPRRGILGFLSPRFSSPVAADAFLSVFSAGGKRFSFAFSAPPKGERRKTKQKRRFRLGFSSSFLFCFPLAKQNYFGSLAERRSSFAFCFSSRENKTTRRRPRTPPAPADART